LVDSILTTSQLFQFSFHLKLVHDTASFLLMVNHLQRTGK
jgi:hypothetical protein